MSQGEYTIEVTSLSPLATDKDVYDFFAFCGAIDHVDILRFGESACTAYVKFRDAHSVQTAVLLSGATIVDQRVCITRWGQHEDEFDIWNTPSWRLQDETTSTQPSDGNYHGSSAGETVTMAQEVVKAMLGKGYVLGKDAIWKARAFDESHQVTATAAAKVAEIDQRMGLSNKIYAGVGAVKSVDERYHVSETTISAVSTAAKTVVNSSYFSKGALWVSGALNRAAKVAADLGGHGGGNK